MRRSCLFTILGLSALTILVCISVQLYMSYRGTLPNIIWKFATDDRVPKVQPYKDRVYATKENVLYALDSKSGQTLWRSEKLAGRYVSRIFPADDLVVVVDATDPLWTIRIDALDAKNGKLVWSIDNLWDGLYGINPFVSTRHVYAGDDKNNFLAIDRKTGKVERTIALGNLVLLEPFGINGLVFYVTSDGRINAIDDESGNLVWATVIPNAPNLTKSKDNRNIFDAYAADSTLFIWEDGGNAVVRAFNLKTGEYLWSSQYAPESYAPPLIENGTLYVALRVTTFESILYAIDSETGKLLFKRIIDTWNVAPVKIAAGNLIVSGRQNAYGVNPKNGEIVWRKSSGAEYYETAIHNGVGYFVWSVGGDELPTRNYFKAISLRDGKEFWDRFYLGGRPWDNIYASDDVLITVGEGVVTAIRFDGE